MSNDVEPHGNWPWAVVEIVKLATRSRANFAVVVILVVLVSGAVWLIENVR